MSTQPTTPSRPPRPPRQPAVVVNPEAGNYDIVSDPATLRACERAIGRTYAMFPYYAERYGDRGRRFSSSDSGWLCLTADAPLERTTQQILWLGQVLAARGMPRVLLEHHLDLLADELEELAQLGASDNSGASDDAYASAESASAARDLAATRADRLRQIAELLRGRRLSTLSEDEVAAIENEFDAAAPAAWGARLPRTGLLISAAVADEVDGLGNVVSSLFDWLSDPDRFDPDWIAAVHAALDRARSFADPA